MLQCRRDLTQQKSWLWLCRAIYKWLVINPRPTLMSSQIFSFLSLTHTCTHRDVLPIDTCLQMWWKGMALSTNSCNLITNKGLDNITYCTHIHKVNDKSTSQWQTSCRSVGAGFIFAQQHSDIAVLGSLLLWQWCQCSEKLSIHQRHICLFSMLSFLTNVFHKEDSIQLQSVCTGDH